MPPVSPNNASPVAVSPVAAAVPGAELGDLRTSPWRDRLPPVRARAASASPSPSFPDSVWERPYPRDSVALLPALRSKLKIPSFPDSVWECPCPRDSVARLPALSSKLSLLSSALPLLSAFYLLTFTFSQACGLDWTLPHAHFEGVDEQGYVSYWEKIGQADLGDGLLIPVHIGFSSHRQASSPILGQGWILPLLESHVEPVDENTLHVLMPDGWTFLFLRNGSTETWRGNAGWVGQTDGTSFTITAPCGWRVKFDTGKIQEIDTPKDRTITIKYNGPAPTEADIDGHAFVQIDDNPATGATQDIVIAGQKIAISQAPRPRIQHVLGKTLITGFDPALSALQWPNGQKETFDFAAPQNLTPSLAITRPGQAQRTITWDPGTSQIETDNQWTYNLAPTENVTLVRSDPKGQTESYFYDPVTGTTTIQGLDGVRIVTTTYVNAGNLTGKVRKVTQFKNGINTVLRRYDYDESGKMIRVILTNPKPHEYTFKYNSKGKQVEVDCDGRVYLKKDFDSQGRLTRKIFSSGMEMTYIYLPSGIQETTTYLKTGKTTVTHFTNTLQTIASQVSTPNPRVTN